MTIIIGVLAALIVAVLFMVALEAANAKTPMGAIPFLVVFLVFAFVFGGITGQYVSHLEECPLHQEVEDENLH